MQNMYTWIKNRNVEKKRKEYSFTDSPDHRRHPSLKTKLEILHRYFEEGEDIKSISEEYGYSRASIYSWRKLYVSGGAAADNVPIIMTDDFYDCVLQEKKSEGPLLAI